MFLWDCVLALLLLPAAPFFYMINLCMIHNHENKNEDLDAFTICKNIIAHNGKNTLGIMASPKEYTDVWTRDAFFSIMGFSKHFPKHPCISRTVNSLERYQRSDGLVPLYIGSGSACSKLVCHVQGDSRVRAHYGDAKTGNMVTDSCFQFIILKRGQGEAAAKAWNFMQKFVKGVLIYEEGLGSWMDTIYHKGHVLYTNVLYYQAAKMMNKNAEEIRQALFDSLWCSDGYFNTSSTLKGFDQVGNALAIRYGLVDESQRSRILSYRRKHFANKVSAPPTFPLAHPVYLPCYMIGNYNYHHYGWSWANLLFVSVMTGKERQDHLKTFTTTVERDGTMYEIYDAQGEPVEACLCESQPDFSEGAGMYLLCCDKRVDEIRYDAPNVAWKATRRTSALSCKEISKNIGFVLIVLSGIIQAVRCVLIANGTLSFWAQALVIASAFFQGTFFFLTRNWQFILIQVGIVVVTSINLYDIIHARNDFLTSW